MSASWVQPCPATAKERCGPCEDDDAATADLSSEHPLMARMQQALAACSLGLRFHCTESADGLRSSRSNVLGFVSKFREVAGVQHNKCTVRSARGH